MKNFLLPIILFAITAAVSHAMMVRAAPTIIMNITMDKMAERGYTVHRFIASPRSTPQTQTVVRPSPDLAYAVCRYDFSFHNTPLQIAAQHWQDYASISFFDAQTNNFATIPVGYAGGETIKTSLQLLPPHLSQTERNTGGIRQITSPTDKGIIIIRRLAPSLELYNAAQAISGSDVCAPVTG